MRERYRSPRRIAPAVLVGVLGLAACSSGGSGESGSASPPPSRTSAVESSGAAPTTQPTQRTERPGGPGTPDRPYPWPFCDKAHRAPLVSFSKDGPIALVDSNCTDPADHYTGVYDSRGPASQAEGTPRGRLLNGSRVVVYCLQQGQVIYNDQGAGSDEWDRVAPLQGEELVLPDGEVTKTTGDEEFLIPNTHLAFFSDPGVGPCPPR